MITQKKRRKELQLLRDEALDAYLNREDFQYDVNADALYKRYKDHYTDLGKKAMQDTVGQAAALTGGYGSSYAQNVGQQAYEGYMQQLGDVVPALYKLAYDRYQDKSDKLYKTYQSWADLEQQAAQQEQWEYELAERKRQNTYNQFLLEQQNNSSKTDNTAYQGDYWAWLSYHQKLGQQQNSKVETAEPQYDNKNVSEGNIKTMQRVLGLQETGKWTEKEHQKAGNRNADDAWLSYQKGQLQNRNSHGQWEQGATVGNIKTMERVLGLEEDGYWSKEDQKAAGGLTAFDAWRDYQQGKLQSRAKSGMSMEEWAEYKSKQAKSSDIDMKETTPAVQNFISSMITEDQAVEHGNNPTEWRMMVVDRLNRVNMTVDEFAQLEKYYGLDIPGSAMPQGSTANNAAQKLSYAEYREKTATQKVSDLNTAVQKFFNTYQLFVNSAVYDIQNVGYKNAASMLEDRVQTAKELQKQAEILASALRMNGDIISGDYSELLTQVVSTKMGVDSIMDAFDGYVKYYSQWDTEDAYKEALAGQKDYEDLLNFDLEEGQKEIDDLTAECEALDWTDYAQRQKMYEYEKLISTKKAYLNRAKRLQEGIQFVSVVNNDDFEYYSALGAAIQNPSVTDAEGYFNFFGWRPGSEEVGNIVTYSRDNYANIAAMSEGGKYDVVGDLRYRDMKDHEVAIYNYLLAKEGKEKAGEFLSYIEEDLNARGGKRIAGQITSIDVPVVEELVTNLYGLGAGIDQWISGARQLFTSEQLPITITQYANSEIADSLDGIDKYAYRGANVIGNMAPSILLSYVTAGLDAPAAVAQGVGAAAVGMSAAGNAYGSALRDGYSIGQARAYSTLVGAAEGTLQYILGGIGSLGGITDDLIKAKINMIDNSLLRLSAKLGVDGFFEIGEEELQNYLEPAFRSIIFGEEYDAPTIDEILETAVVTGITNLVLGGGDTVSSDLSENKQLVESGKKILGTDGGKDALMNLANEIAGMSSAEMQSTLTSQIDKVNQNPTARNIGQLYATIQTASNEANASVTPEDVTKMLRSKRVDSKTTADIADAIAASLNGQELTKTQRKRLSSALDSPTVQSVISDMQKTLTSRSDNVSQKPTARNVGQLYTTVQAANDQANASVNQEDVAERLLEKGFYSKEAAGVAEAVAVSLNEQDLTRTQRSILSSALSSSAVRDTISEFMQKKADGVDSAQNRVYDKDDIGDRLSDGEKSASWDGYNLEVPSTAHQRELTSAADVLEDASVTEGSSSRQAPNVSSEETDNRDIKSGRVLSNGQSLDNMAELYAEKVHSNRKWRWRDGFPNGGRLSKNDKIDIRKYAIEKGLIPNVPVNVVTDASGKIYRYADFDAAGMVKEKVDLPEYLWSKSDAVHIKWLDDKIGGRPKGHTWHHSEKDGQMELVPTGIHNVYHHNGGRTVNHWAYRKGGR